VSVKLSGGVADGVAPNAATAIRGADLQDTEAGAGFWTQRNGGSAHTLDKTSSSPMTPSAETRRGDLPMRHGQPRRRRSAVRVVLCGIDELERHRQSGSA
jgi:hypothetical protein